MLDTREKFKDSVIFDLENSPGSVISDVKGVGYDKAVRAINSPGGKFKRFEITRGTSSKKSFDLRHSVLENIVRIPFIIIGAILVMLFGIK